MLELRLLGDKEEREFLLEMCFTIEFCDMKSDSSLSQRYMSKSPRSGELD
jgi:hypothetical protein